MLRQLVEGQSLFEQLGETGRVAKQRPVVDAFAAAQQLLEGTVEPDRRAARRADELQVGRLHEGSASERDDRRLRLRGFGKDGVFHDAKRRFAFALENLAHGLASGGFDGGVKVDEGPSQLLREKLPQN